MKHNAILINPGDNVAVCLEDIKAGNPAILPDGTKIEALSDIGYSHKILLADVQQGDPIIKYGEIIATMNRDARKGDTVHTHNLNLEE